MKNRREPYSAMTTDVPANRGCHSLPAIRACIFDMDGLLINSEDIIALSINQLLEKYGRPALTPSIRARLMGVHDSSNGDLFHDYARLPISREQWARESKEHMQRLFPECAPLPGAERLLSNLSRACTRGASSERIQLALASSTRSDSYKLKTSNPRTKQLLEVFQDERRILGDDPRLAHGRGKPAPDIYLLALEVLNSAAGSSDRPIKPSECLVFEDSVAGVEAGRRAGMRVVWVPNPDVASEYEAKHEEILAGTSGDFELGHHSQLGATADGWAELIPSLEHFKYQQYGIELPA